MLNFEEADGLGRHKYVSGILKGWKFKLDFQMVFIPQTRIGLYFALFLQIKTLADNTTENKKICGFNGSVTCSWSIHPLGSTWTEKHLGAKYLFFFLLSFPQNERKINKFCSVCIFFEGRVFTFQFMDDKFHHYIFFEIVNFTIQ